MKAARDKFIREFQDLCADYDIKAFALSYLHSDEETISSIHGEIYKSPENCSIEHEVLIGRVANALVEWLKFIDAPVKFDCD